MNIYSVKKSTTISKVKFLLLLFSFMLICFKSMAYDFNYDNVFIAYLKLNNSIKPRNIADDYMKVYSEDVWDGMKGNEAQLKNKRKETIKLIKDKVSDMDLEEEFIITTNLKFGEYDFDRESFYFQPLTRQSYFPVLNYKGGLPAQLNVFFDNTEIVDGIPMTKDVAKSFLTRKKNSWGIDREVAAVIKFNMIKSTKENELLGHIINVSLYENNKLINDYNAAK